MNLCRMPEGLDGASVQRTALARADGRAEGLEQGARKTDDGVVIGLVQTRPRLFPALRRQLSAISGRIRA